MSCPADDDSTSQCSPINGNKYANYIIPGDILNKLDNKRIRSNIPNKDSSNWLYPSHRQFYKSTVNKGHNIDVELIPTIVDIHNVINEKAWEKVMEYESLHKNQCKNSLLVRFVGKRNEPSIRSMIYQLLGYKAPYDRHDWFVDRCGKRIR